MPSIQKSGIEAADTLTMTPAVAEKAKELLTARLSLWMTNYLAIPGFADWKNEKLKEQLLLNVIPGYQVSDFEEFPMPSEIVEQHVLITGYYNIVSSVLTLRQTERYFRRYPFRDREVSREDHLKTCCELLFSRLYHFRERFFMRATPRGYAALPTRYGRPAIPLPPRHPG